MVIQSGALGVLLTFAPRPWYTAYAGSTAAWGLTPLDDQRLAGLIMWLPAGAVYLVAIGVVFAGWLKASEQAERRREAHAAPRQIPTPGSR
jgi:cytochrome c oxidase assembly factor CtaG